MLCTQCSLQVKYVSRIVWSTSFLIYNDYAFTLASSQHHILPSIIPPFCSLAPAIPSSQLTTTIAFYLPSSHPLSFPPFCFYHSAQLPTILLSASHPPILSASHHIAFYLSTSHHTTFYLIPPSQPTNTFHHTSLPSPLRSTSQHPNMLTSTYQPSIHTIHMQYIQSIVYTILSTPYHPQISLHPYHLEPPPVYCVCICLCHYCTAQSYTQTRIQINMPNSIHCFAVLCNIVNDKY